MPKLTRHAQARLQQRGLRPKDVNFIWDHGTPIGDAVAITRSDLNQIIAEAKRTIAIAERLHGKVLIEGGGSIITAFHPEKLRVD